MNYRILIPTLWFSFKIKNSLSSLPDSILLHQTLLSSHCSPLSPQIARSRDCSQPLSLRLSPAGSPRIPNTCYLKSLSPTVCAFSDAIHLCYWLASLEYWVLQFQVHIPLPFTDANFVSIKLLILSTSLSGGDQMTNKLTLFSDSRFKGVPLPQHLPFVGKEPQELYLVIMVHTPHLWSFWKLLSGMLPVIWVNKGCQCPRLQPSNVSPEETCEILWYLALDSWGVYQRNDFSEPILLHLPTCWKARKVGKVLSSLTWDIWFPSISNNLLKFRLPTFHYYITWRPLSFPLSGSLSYLRCWLPDLRSYKFPPNKT